MKFERRIRLVNTISAILNVIGVVVLFYIYFISWHPSFFLLMSFIVAFSFIPHILNYFQKTLASRIFLIALAYIAVLLTAIAIGPALNFQYFLFAFFKHHPLCKRFYGASINFFPVLSFC